MKTQVSTYQLHFSLVFTTLDLGGACPSDRYVRAAPPQKKTAIEV